tara:strand:+ start:429 stop:1082 length:654 start_codon:yes stop_codon:yes gene_type:complete
MEDVQPRQLFKQMAGGYGSVIIDEGSITSATVNGEGWEYIPQDHGNFVGYVNRQYIDLAGYTLDELTTFVNGVDIQRDKDPTGFEADLPIVWEYDLITTRRIRNDELGSLFQSPPGWLSQTVDLQEVIYGETKTHAFNANVLATAVSTKQSTFGSGNASAADRLHWTKIYLLGTVGNALFTYFENNLAVQAITAKEKDLVWMERLRRAYTQDPGRNV